MKDIIIISGERKSGKTYKMISYAVKSTISCENNVFIVASTTRSLDYFEHIIIKEFPSLRFERRKEGFMFYTSTYSWFIYCVPICDVHKYYQELSEADEIMIDEYPTFTHLIKNKNIVNAMRNATSIIVTISDYYLFTVRFGVTKVINEFGRNVIIKRL